MAIQMTGRLISWLGARGYLGDSVDYWRARLHAPGPRGGKHKNSRVAQIIYIEHWTPQTGNLLSGLRAAVDARPCGLKFNSVKPAKRAISQLDALRRAADAKNHKAEPLRGSALSAADPGGPQVPQHARALL